MILKELEVVDKLDLPAVDISIYSNGIMHIHIKLRNTLELSDAMNILEARTNLAKGKKHPTLFTTEHSFVTPSKKVNDYLASEKRAQLSLADAFLMKSLPQRLAGKTYLLFKTPVRPSKFFSNESEAINWLKAFV
jgi:hypothetical protein